ncbi:MAG: signal peptidase II [Alphaproteobacteria bacterium]|nr:signal peptidase II [Alphaproteobacteria bacterium]
MPTMQSGGLRLMPALSFAPLSVRHFNIGVYLATFVALLDQGSKAVVLDMFSRGSSPVYINPILNFRLSWNKGVTFGLFNDLGVWMPHLLTFGALAIALLLLRWLYRVNTMPACLGLGCVMGGAAGNIIDRLQHGAVVDFIDLHLGNYHWYTFNVADSAIVIGVCLLLLENMLESLHKESR